MSVSGPIGRTPRQVAGPGAEDDEVEPIEPESVERESVEPEPGRSVFETTPEGEEVVEPDPVLESAPPPEPGTALESEPPPEHLAEADGAPEPDPVPDPDAEPEHLAEPEPALRAEPDREVEPATEPAPEPVTEVPAAVEALPAPDPDRDIDEDPVFIDDVPGDGTDVEPAMGPDEGADERTVEVPAPFDPAAGFMGDTDDLRDRWETVQAGFVDDPRQAVVEADEMVSVAVAALQARVEQRREDLAETWRSGDHPSTDDLLTAFQRYRDLFDGVLST